MESGQEQHKSCASTDCRRNTEHRGNSSLILFDGSKELNTVYSLTLNSELSVTGLQFIPITLQNDLVLIRTPH